MTSVGGVRTRSIGLLAASLAFFLAVTVQATPEPDIRAKKLPRLTFHNKSLPEVAKILSDTSGVKVILAPEIQDCMTKPDSCCDWRITVGSEKSSLESALDALTSSAHLSYRVVDEKTVEITTRNRNVQPAGLASSSPHIFSQRVSTVALEGAPLTLTAHVVSEANPAGVAFEASNVTNLPIQDYGVRIFVYRKNGRPPGFITKHETPYVLQPGTSHSSIASLGEIPLTADSVVLVQLTMARFDNDSRWMAAPDALDRVKSEVARLTGIVPGR
jgi:hypothetical protein